MNIAKKYIKSNDLQSFQTHLFSNTTSELIIASIIFCLKRSKYDFVDAIINKYNLNMNVLLGFYEACKKYPSQKDIFLSYLKSKNIITRVYFIVKLMIMYNYTFFLDLVKEDVVKFDTSIVDEDLFNSIEYMTIRLSHNNQVMQLLLDTKQEAYNTLKCITDFTIIIYRKYKIFFSEYKYNNLLKYFQEYVEKYGNVGVSDFYDLGLTVYPKINKKYIGDVITSFYFEDKYDLYMKHIHLLVKQSDYRTLMYTITTSEEFISSLYNYLYKSGIRVDLKNVIRSITKRNDVKYLLKHIYSIYKKQNNHTLEEEIKYVLYYQQKGYKNILHYAIYHTEQYVTSKLLCSLPINVILEYTNSSDTIPVVFEQELYEIYYVNMNDYKTVDEFVEDLCNYTEVFVGEYSEADKDEYTEKQKHSLMNRSVKQVLEKRLYIEKLLQKNISSVVYGYLL